MTRTRRIAAFAVCGVILVLVAYYASQQYGGPAAPGPAPGTVRLGPEPGEGLAEYLGRLPAELPAPGASAPALVQLDAEITPAAAAALVGDRRVLTAVFRVPIPRVQTALRFQTLDAGVPNPAALDTARQRAGAAAEADASRLTGRSGAVASAEARALTRTPPAPPCACVVALVVQADRAGLDALVAAPGVRAVQAAPAGTVPVELALSPLLPEQTGTADPLPDDGAVPAG
ncbi:MAG: hypothetical protein OJJ54_12655 [Pseudonocardia sp.]|nr:hypothetical protein [Pseudonocardia sp.]